MAEKRKAKAVKVAAAAAAMVVVGSGAALAATIPGTDRGEVLRGTPYADTIHGYGGADLIYGFGGRDTVWGGNEVGPGDKILGGTGHDGLIGQRGNDALYGQGGKDWLDGQNGDDLVVGGFGEDTLIGGPGADEVNAQDGQKDTIAIRFGEGDLVYYDRGLDVLEAPASPQGDASLTAAEADEMGVELRTGKPPEGLFAHTGKVLVEHKGEKLLVAEKDLKGHVAHGDEILDPTGRSGAEGGQR